MTDQDDLQDRLTQVVDVALYMWTNDPETTGTDGEFVAQAIIEDLGLHVIETTGCVIGKLERP